MKRTLVVVGTARYSPLVLRDVALHAVGSELVGVRHGDTGEEGDKKAATRRTDVLHSNWKRQHGPAGGQWWVLVRRKSCACVCVLPSVLVNGSVLLCSVPALETFCLLPPCMLVCVCVCMCVCVHAPVRAPIKHTQYQAAVASSTFTKTIWVCGPRTLQQITNPQARHAHSCVVASPSGLLVGVADGVGDLLLVDVHKHRLHALWVGRHRHLHAEHICWGNIGRLWWYAQREHNLHHKAWRVRPDVGIVGIGTCNRHGHRTFSGGGGLRMNLDPPGMYGTT